MAPAPPAQTLTIAKSDYDAFERLLGDIQAAYSTEDLSALRAKVTPEMLSYFSDQLAGNASRGLINHVTDVKLLQGDLAEAWREGGTDYATVAMKFALKDSMVERASGRTVEGGERTRSPNGGPLCAPVAGFGCCRPSSRLDVRHNHRPHGRWSATRPISLGPNGTTICRDRNARPSVSCRI